MANVLRFVLRKNERGEIRGPQLEEKCCDTTFCLDEMVGEVEFVSGVNLHNLREWCGVELDQARGKNNGTHAVNQNFFVLS